MQSWRNKVFGLRTLRALMKPGKWYTFDELLALCQNTMSPERALRSFTTDKSALGRKHRELIEQDRAAVIEERFEKYGERGTMVALGKRVLLRQCLNGQTTRVEASPIIRRGKRSGAQFQMVRWPCKYCGQIFHVDQLSHHACEHCRDWRKRAGL